MIPDERRASLRFIEQVLRPDKDMAFVIHFDFEVELLEDLTNSREKLEKALDQLDSSQPQLQRQQQGGGYPGGGYPGGGQGGQRGGRGRGGGGTDLYDAVYLAGDELMRKQKGRKALILLSDGVDTGSKETLEQRRRIGAAGRYAGLLDPIRRSQRLWKQHMGGFGGPRMGRRGGMGGGRGGNRYPTMNRPDGKKILEQISRETGGRFFEVSHKWPIDKIYDAIEEDLRNQYNLGYTPTSRARTADIAESISRPSKKGTSCRPAKGTTRLPDLREVAGRGGPCGRGVMASTTASGSATTDHMARCRSSMNRSSTIARAARCRNRRNR